MKFDFSKDIVYTHRIDFLKPFLFLSYRSIKILIEIIEKNYYRSRSSDRIPIFIRGLGYHSRFIRDLCYHSDTLNHLRKLTGINLIPHYLFSNVGHVNIGIPNDKEID